MRKKPVIFFVIILAVIFSYIAWVDINTYYCRGIERGKHWQEFQRDLNASGYSPNNDILRGSLAWKVRYGINEGYPNEMAIVVDYNETGRHNIVYAVWNLNPFLFAINGKTGEKIWETKLAESGDPGGLLFWEDRIFVSLCNKTTEEEFLLVENDNYFFCSFYSINATNGKKLWERDGFEGVITPGKILNGTVYFQGTNTNHVNALDAMTGEIVWERNVTSSEISTHAPGFWTDGKDSYLFVGDTAGMMTALSALDGDTFYTFEYQGKKKNIQMTVTPLYGLFGNSPGGDICISGNWEGKVFAFNCSNGEMVWDKFIGGSRNSGECIGSPATQWNHNTKEGSIYLGCEDGNFYKLNAYNGDIIWRFDTSSLPPKGIYRNIRQSPALSDNIVYFGNSGPGIGNRANGTFYALSIQDGRMVWKYSDTGGDFYLGNPAVSDGYIYTGNLDGYLYAFNDTC